MDVVSGFAFVVSPTTLIPMPHSQRHVDTVLIIEAAHHTPGRAGKILKLMTVCTRAGGNAPELVPSTSRSGSATMRGQMLTQSAGCVYPVKLSGKA
jgi:hypothetical protein